MLLPDDQAIARVGAPHLRALRRGGGPGRVCDPTSWERDLIAPHLALTAKHVLERLFALTEQPVPRRRGNFETGHGARLVQTLPPELGGKSSVWSVNRSWQSTPHKLR